ncbi:MAG: CvpA family protein [Anaerolineaceae bacterium]|nr:CvpA family protein [Anaerolineaceae bacterium]
MIGLNILFIIFVLMFAIIGLMRGWAKELLVSFSVILSLFVTMVLEKFVPFIQNLATTGDTTTLFWVRFVLLLGLVIFGYQSPNIGRLAESGKFARERLQDSMLGLFLGAVNGYFVFGSIWYFLDTASYPFDFITPPVAGTAMGDAAIRLIESLPPQWLGDPTIYFAVAIAFAFVLVVFI